MIRNGDKIDEDIDWRITWMKNITVQCATYIVQVLETQTVQQSLGEIIAQLYELILQAVQDLALDMNMMSVFTHLID